MTNIHRQTNKQQGSIALLTAIILPILILITGTAIDFARLQGAKSIAEQAAEAVALQVVSNQLFGSSARNSRTEGREFFDTQELQIPHSNDASARIRTQNTSDGYRADVSVSGSIETTFLQIAKITELDFEVKTVAQVTANNFEISLVLDISQSMRNDLSTLIASTESFINILYENNLPSGIERAISIIPYADSVNFGTSASNYLDPNPAVGFPEDFEGCFRPTSDRDITSTNPLDRPGDFSALRSIAIGRLGNRTCPPEQSSVLMFSDDQRELLAKARDLKLGYGTGSDIALSWGWRSLTPSWRGEFNEDRTFPKNYNSTQKKFLIFLTDGRPVRSDPHGDGRRRPKAGGSLRTDNQQALNNLEDICDAIESEDEVELFTIGFRLGTANPDNQQVLRNCTARTGQYFDPDPAELDTTFREIARQIINVRVVD